jgi:hypothetical protein
LSPNPTNENLHVQLLKQPSSNLINYTILNSLGEITAQGVIDHGEQNSFDIDIRSKGLPAGIYYLCLKTDVHTEVQKFIFNH